MIEIPLNGEAKAVIERRWNKSADLLFASPRIKGAIGKASNDFEL